MIDTPLEIPYVTARKQSVVPDSLSVTVNELPKKKFILSTSSIFAYNNTTEY